MIRVLGSKLITNDSGTYYNNQPFTGIAYLLDNGVITEVVEYDKGNKLGKHYDQYLDLDNKAYGINGTVLGQEALHVDSDVLIPEDLGYNGDPPCLYKDKYFTGLATEFVDGYVIETEIFVNGLSEGLVQYRI